MSAPPPADFDDLPAPHKALVNTACERFEAALRAGRGGPPDDYLADVPAALRPVLLGELLALECEYRGPCPSAHLAGRVGPYETADELGRGGFGVVYRATDTRDGRTYAVKVPHPAALADPAFLPRFRREAEAAARLDHPNVVRVHEVQADGPACYLAAEYVAGPTLAAWLAGRTARGAPVPVRAAAGLIAALADAVQHAHDRGVLHRDLKPSNVLLQKSEDRGRKSEVSEELPFQTSDLCPLTSDLCPKITDFGLARLGDGDADLSRSGQVVGTPAYMAPEQVAGRRRAVSPRTDVYALGVILFEVLAGRPPFADGPSLELLVRVLRDDPPDLRQLRRDVPADLEAVCLTCLAKDPARRYASARELADDLRRFLAGGRTHARPPGPVRRAGKWLRRHPITGLAMAAAAFLLTAGAVHTYRLEAVNADLTAALAERDASNRQYRRAAYADAVRRTEALLERGDDPEAQRLLAEWEPRPGEEELRGWEWHYLSRRTRRGQIACWNVGVTYTLAFRPDGGALAGAGADGRLRVWDPDTGRDLAPPRPHPADIGPVVWAADGEWLASACDDGVVRVWPAAGGPAVELTGHTDKVKDLALSPDGRTLASAGKDGTVRLWDTADWRKPGHVLVREPDSLRAVAFGPDDTLLVSGTIDNHIKFWDRATGRLRASHPANYRPTNFIRSVPGQPGFVSTARDVTLWEPTAGSGGWHRAVLPGLNDRVRDVAVSRDGRTLAVAGDGGATVWDWKGPRFRCRVYGHRGLVHAVAFHPDGRRLATAGADGTVRLWDLGTVPVAVRSPLVGDPVQLTVLPDRQVCVTIRPQGWCAHIRGNGGGPTLAEGRGPITGAALTPDGAAVLTIDSRGRVRHWPLAGGDDGTPLFTLSDDPVPHVRGLAVSPDGQRFATAVGGSVALFDATGRRVATLPGNEAPAALVFAPDGRTLATGGPDRRVSLWDATTGAQRAALPAHSAYVNAVAFAPDGRTLASAGEGHVIHLWDRAGRSLGLLAGHRGAVLGLAFSPDGRTLASVGADGTARLWQLATGSELLTFDVADHLVTHVAFSPDGRYLAFAGPPNPGRQVPGEGFLEIHDCGWPLTAPPNP